MRTGRRRKHDAARNPLQVVDSFGVLRRQLAQNNEIRNVDANQEAASTTLSEPFHQITAA